MVFDLYKVIQNSIYYPSSAFDGSVVKAYAKEYQNFVYCDYGVTEDGFLKKIETFRGYNVLNSRPVEQEELIPKGWNQQIPLHLLNGYTKYAAYVKEPFAYLVLYERKPEYSDLHGPLQFNLLYIGGEGVATYQALYWGNRLTAKAIAIVRPGTGFGLNWTNFLNGDKALGYVVTNNPFGQPDFITTCSRGLLNWHNYPTQTSERYCRFSRDQLQVFYEYKRMEQPIIS